MSGMKRFAEDIAAELGKDDINDPDVVLLGTLRLNKRSYEKEARFWVNYAVNTDGSVVFARSYQHSEIRHQWEAFLNDLRAHAEPGTWRVVEDSLMRKAVAFDYPDIKMTVFQLATINALCDLPPAVEQGEYKSMGQCIQDGTHLTDCDDDGYCNYCGEQDSGEL